MIDLLNWIFIEGWVLFSISQHIDIMLTLISFSIHSLQALTMDSIHKPINLTTCF